MDKEFTRFGKWVALKGLMLLFGLLWAFPLMWCWNYSATHVFNAPEVTWGQTWCLFVLLGQCKSVIMWCDHKVPEEQS